MAPTRPSDRPAPFDAVLFDLDGTLVATDRFWVAAGRAGARRALATLGIERELPSAAQWMGMCGKPLAQGFDEIFGDLARDARQKVMQACLEEEHALLDAGGAALLPQAREVLTSLRREGVRLGIASNCSQGYLDHMLEALELGSLVDEARCLDSPGVADKADMLADLLLTFDTRSAVMVGDRSTDREAAWANGLPYVHLEGGFAEEGEGEGAEARLLGLDQLLARLEGRNAWIEGALEELGVFAALGSRPRLFGLDGPPGSGRSLFARDARRLAAARGLDLVPLDLERYRLSQEPDPEDPAGGAFDLRALAQEVLVPFAFGRRVEVARTAAGSAEPLVVEPGAVLLLEGPYLFDPRLRSRCDGVLRLEVPEDVLLRRLAGRDGRLAGPQALGRARQELAQTQAFARQYPAGATDLVLEGANSLGPRP